MKPVRDYNDGRKRLSVGRINRICFQAVVFAIETYFVILRVFIRACFIKLAHLDKWKNDFTTEEKTCIEKGFEF